MIPKFLAFSKISDFIISLKVMYLLIFICVRNNMTFLLQSSCYRLSINIEQKDVDPSAKEVTF